MIESPEKVNERKLNGRGAVVRKQDRLSQHEAGESGGLKEKGVNDALDGMQAQSHDIENVCDEGGDLSDVFLESSVKSLSENESSATILLKVSFITLT